MFKKGDKVLIIDKWLQYYYKKPDVQDIVYSVLYDPFSKKTSVLLKNSSEEFILPANLKLIK